MAGKKGMQMSNKRTYDPDDLAERTATALINGNGRLRTSRSLAPVSEIDKRLLTRITGLSVDAFNERLSDKLGIIADKAADKLLEKLEADAINPNSLGFNLAVAIDKRSVIDGRTQLHASSVNVTVNNFNARSPKAAILDALAGKSPSSHADIPIDAQAG